MLLSVRACWDPHSCVYFPRHWCFSHFPFTFWHTPAMLRATYIWLRDHSRLSNHMWCWGWTSGRPHARKVPYLLYYTFVLHQLFVGITFKHSWSTICRWGNWDWRTQMMCWRSPRAHDSKSNGSHCQRFPNSSAALSLSPFWSFTSLCIFQQESGSSWLTGLL